MLTIMFLSHDQIQLLNVPRQESLFARLGVTFIQLFGPILTHTNCIIDLVNKHYTRADTNPNKKLNICN